MKQASMEVKVEKIFAGKLRRYHGVPLWRQAGDLPTLFRNVIDMVIIGLGFIQSVVKLCVWRPQVVFCKGGFVSLPVGYAAALLRIPIVIHDSDTRPGLTNKLLAPFATFIATGAPLKYYTYPRSKTHYTGIPVKSEYRPLSSSDKEQTKKVFGLAPDKPLLVVVGGGLGAKKINDAMMAIAPEIINRLSVVHLCGLKQYEELKTKMPPGASYKLIAFESKRLAQLLASSDIVVTRAGATSMAELAAVEASVIMIPASQLADQQKNAEVFLKAKAALLVDERRLQNEPELLLQTIVRLLDNPTEKQSLRTHLSRFANPMAAKDVAKLIEAAARR
jgi:UDP-N-acetylglucosamine--N-acetylmuramyl-(pentapeptide) pyrophosphoryl-undecaprenol N-acetylglucosamine transferase